MKFKSVIEVIMHALLPTARVVLLVCLGMSPACVSIIADKHTYESGVSSPMVKVNGAEIRLNLKPEGEDGGSYAVSAMVVSAAATTLDGPFRWRVMAMGMQDVHESVIVHNIRTRTMLTKRDEWYPARHLGERADFSPDKKAPGKSRAIYQIPGLLKVKPREDGALEVLVDLTVRAQGGGERKLVRFRLDPAHKRQDEFIFLPTEIITHIGKPMSEWEDPGWD
jgi:hypothetical protein